MPGGRVREFGEGVRGDSGLNIVKVVEDSEEEGF